VFVSVLNVYRFFTAILTVTSFHCSSTSCLETTYHLLYALSCSVCVNVQNMALQFVDVVLILQHGK